jgi:hypothetical protein
LVLFFRKEQDSSFSEEKEAKRLLRLHLFKHTGLGRGGVRGLVGATWILGTLLP